MSGIEGFSNQHDNRSIHQYLSRENISYVEKILLDVIRVGLQFKTRDQVVEAKNYGFLFDEIYESSPLDGDSIENIIQNVTEKIVKYSTNYSSEMAMAFPDAGNSIAGLSGAILADLLNQNLINWTPCSPAATVVEVTVIRWFRELIGYNSPNVLHSKPLDVGGFITSGGVSSNTVALLVAREHLLPNTMRSGLADPTKSIKIFVPDGVDHYSSRLSAGWLGLGEESIIKIPTIHFRYDLDFLRNMMNRIAAASDTKMIVVAYAGDSRTMTCDNFSELRTICDEHLAWLHIDACHGTQLLFSEQLRNRIEGIKEADSITLDPHKVFNVPYVLSIVLFKATEALEVVRRPEDIITGEEHSFGQITPLFGSRPFSALKLYMLIKNLGINGLGRVVERRHKLAQTLASMIENDDDFILVNSDVNINSVAFMYWPKQRRVSTITAECVNYFNGINTNIQKYLFDSGKVWLHNFSLPDSDNVIGLGRNIILRPLRYMSGNPNVDENYLYQMITEVREIGQTLDQQISKG
jgi:L-2,4-diaminobutyrate decarboxylase